jgi:Helix-turn-helix domain
VPGPAQGPSARQPPGPPGGPQERPGVQVLRGIQAVPVAGEPNGPTIRQRESAVPADRQEAQRQPVASIAPDGLESFARDLRTLRSQAGLDYPELAERSHYTMKTLASAAGGLRLPTLPVAVAYVRACGGNVTEWEERWQRLAANISADPATRRRADGADRADPPATAEPPVPTAAADPDPDPGAVYVITSAKPRQPGWPVGLRQAR